MATKKDLDKRISKLEKHKIDKSKGPLMVIYEPDQPKPVLTEEEKKYATQIIYMPYNNRDERKPGVYRI